MLNIDFRPSFSSPSPAIVTPFMSLTGQKTTDNQPITDALLPVPQFFNSIMQLKKEINYAISVFGWYNDFRINVMIAILLFHAYTCIRRFKNRKTWFVLSIKQLWIKLPSLACEANAPASEPQKYFRIPVRTWTNTVQKVCKESL